ncbi:MAG: UDP-N-acetylmuramoyl-L-alanine--D-glutamate ligase [Anaerolineales bacterium]|nr:UDP-N-acetylmuramoyl-L-alanine--D-glutamate ligase [Anaerolineales bacterium]MCW5856385.1 UDP-N-acetylmuramoyl-L-alanine--D-glutamate ligase [Anaerolineales bacterium]
MIDWKAARVVVVGAGRQGQATAVYAAGRGAQVVLNDARPQAELVEAKQRLANLPVEWHLGNHPLQLLDGADVLFVSGGVPSDNPLVAEARARDLPISNDSQLFLELAPCRVVGITGSAGKTTTTMLVGRMLAAMQGRGVRRAWVGGNIGNPLLADMDQMQAEDVAVMELSSFQLEWMTRSPSVAAILNLAPNHLDRHGTMESYTAAKARILDFQMPGDSAVLNREDAATWALASQVRGQLWSFGHGELPFGQNGTCLRDGQVWLRTTQGETAVLQVNQVQLIGDHNLSNVLAACAIAAAAGADAEALRAGVQGFHGAPHRLEWVRSLNDADWYNDSIATAPQRTEAALHSFIRPIVLLLGGRDKGLPWADLARLAAQRSRHVVLFGEAAPMLESVFAAHAPQLPRIQAADLAAAVHAAAAAAQPGDVVLLAPGGTSFDEFVDFEARGERFRQLVKEL